NIDGPVTTATCIPAWVDELSDNIVLEKRYRDSLVDKAMEDALEGTRFEPVVEVELGEATTSFYKLNSVECLFKIIEVWGGDLSDEVELDDEGRISARKIYLKSRLGEDRGLRFEIDYN